MPTFEWVIAITGIAIGLGVTGIRADLFAVKPIGIAVDLKSEDLWKRGDWQTVWQMYVGAQYL